MANYHSPTVIQQMIPTADMTALEQLFLGEIFDAEFDGEAVYLCTDEGPRDMLYIDADKLREGVGDPAAADTTALSQIVGQYGEEILADGEVEIDASCEGGACLTCKTRYLGGVPIHRDLVMKPTERREFMTPCVSGCASERLVLDL